MLKNRSWGWLKRWEFLLLAVLIVIVSFNLVSSPFYLGVDNQVNLFELHIEKIIVALTLTLIIINGEIDLSVASVMGLSACVMATIVQQGGSITVAILASLAAGLICGAINGFWVAYAGLPSLAVTLAGLIGYRGLAEVLVADRSIGNFPDWFDTLGQKNLIGPFPAAILLFFILFVVFAIILHYSAFGRYVYIIGNNREAARYSGVKVRRVKMILFMTSGLIASLAGLLYAARLGAVRASTAQGFELDIITMVLLGGVSIFGGTGTLAGVGLSILIILNLRNGLSLINITANTQTSVIGVLLILSVLVPNLARDAQGIWKRRMVRSREGIVHEEEAHSAR
jgi:rhamnose transport system permease protein